MEFLKLLKPKQNHLYNTQQNQDPCHPNAIHKTLSSVIDRDTRDYQAKLQRSKEFEMDDILLDCARKCLTYVHTHYIECYHILPQPILGRAQHRYSLEATSESEQVCLDARNGACGGQDVCPPEATRCRQLLPKPGAEFVAGLSTIKDVA